MIVRSESNYKPIPKVNLNYYKSPQERENQRKDLALGISISGGGSRAQYFGFGVLIGLDEVKINNTFLREVDYFSTVSGGGFAAGYYMTLKQNNVLNDYNSLLDYWKSDVRKKELQEFLFKDAQALSILKLKRYEKNKIRKTYPKMIDYELLQYGKKYKGKKIEKLYLKNFFIPSESNLKVTMPMLVTNGTVYNNGERLPFMPHIIDSLGIIGSLMPEETFNIEKGYGLPLNYAITGSAAFPGVLPMLKLSLKDKPNRVIRVIDGGAVDNLGFTTLFELLSNDLVSNDNKKMLIIDCGGLGPETREQNKDRVKLFPLLKKSLLYTVDIKLLYSNFDIDVLSSYYDFNRKNIERIGISTIKGEFNSLKDNSDDTIKDDIENLKLKMRNGDMDWEDLYRDLADSPAINGYNEHNLSEIPVERFAQFTAKETFEVFELASQVITKIKIYPWEKQVLILAGRYAVYLRRNEIKSLMQ